MPAIVPPKAVCRGCGGAVDPGRSCPKCGRRAILALFWPPPWLRQH